MKLSWGSLSWMTQGIHQHGPQVWPWWKLVACNVVELTCYDHTHLGWRIWFYTKWGSQYFNYYNDADLLWQHILDKNAVFRTQVFNNEFSRPYPKVSVEA